MFDTIFTACEKVGLGHFTNIVGAAEQLASLFAHDYMEDKDARDAAIDAICQYLQKLKD